MADDDLAYGDYHGHGGEETDRGFLGATFRRFTGGVQNQSQQPVRGSTTPNQFLLS
jgi:hypothetical protein